MISTEKRVTFCRCLDSQINTLSSMVNIFMDRYYLQEADALKLVNELANEYNVKLTK